MIDKRMKASIGITTAIGAAVGTITNGIIDSISYVYQQPNKGYK